MLQTECTMRGGCNDLAATQFIYCWPSQLGIAERVELRLREGVYAFTHAPEEEEERASELFSFLLCFASAPLKENPAQCCFSPSLGVGLLDFKLSHSSSPSLGLVSLHTSLRTPSPTPDDPPAFDRHQPHSISINIHGMAWIAHEWRCVGMPETLDARNTNRYAKKLKHAQQSALSSTHVVTFPALHPRSRPIGHEVESLHTSEVADELRHL